MKNDMYYIANVQLPLPDSVRLTTTGKEHLLFNGVPDWVYQGKNCEPNGLNI